MDPNTALKEDPKIKAREIVRLNITVWLRLHPEAVGGVVKVIFSSICRQNGLDPDQETLADFGLPEGAKARLSQALPDKNLPR